MTQTSYRVSIRNISDYSPFGVPLDGRTVSSEEYRFGFQGQEMDDEIKGEGNSVNYKYRMHDPRVGRFFAVDPLTAKYPFYSSYQFSGNRPIDAVELEGLEEFILISDGSSYTLVWDITARGRQKEGVYNGENQTGTIMVVNTSGKILEDVRKLSAEELGYDWIKDRRATSTPNKKYFGTEWKGAYEGGKLDHDEDGTKKSLGYGSTGFVGDDGWVTRELKDLPLDFNVPQPVTPAPTSGTIDPTSTPLTQAKLTTALNGGFSTIGFKISGSQITPIVNSSSVSGSASTIGSQLKGTSFTSLTFNISVYLSDNNTLRWVGADAQKKAAISFGSQIQTQIAKGAGVSTSKIKVNFNFTSDPNKQKFNATFKN
jgi:RHS repeat-associated protein